MAAAMIKRLIKPSASSITSNHYTLSHPLTPISPAFSLLSLRSFVSRLFVGGLSYNTTEDSLKNVFSEHGQVLEVKIMRDRVSDRSKGFGFVSFASKEEADQALTEMNGKQLDGRSIFVDQARPQRTSFRSEMPIARGPPEKS